MRLAYRVCVPFVLAATFVACAAPTDSEPEVSSTEEAATALPTYDQVIQNAKPAVLGMGVTGELVIDATAGKSLLVTPSKTLWFESDAAFVKYARSKTYAQPVYGPNGELRGVTGSVRTLGNLVTVDHYKKTTAAVADPIAAVLGGSAGYVDVGTRRICLTRACAEALGQLTSAQPTKPLGSRSVCSTDGSLCVNGGTGRTDILNYHNRHAWSDLAGAPFWCTWFGLFCPAGADLFVRATYVKNDGTTWGAHERSGTNVSHVELHRWAIDWFFFGSSGEGDVLRTSGVCGEHRGQRGNTVVSFTTSDGDTHGRCP